MTLRVAGSFYTRVSGSLANVITHSVLSARSRLAHQFSLAVSVVVIHLELGVMGSGTNVAP